MHTDRLLAPEIARATALVEDGALARIVQERSGLTAFPV
jgi:hypothetical protein